MENIEKKFEEKLKKELGIGKRSGKPFIGGIHTCAKACWEIHREESERQSKMFAKWFYKKMELKFTDTEAQKMYDLFLNDQNKKG